jgi:Tfp pilus assembly protein PilE
MSPSERNALTPVEVLIAVLITALLIGLLLPAIQKIRATGARANCSNNLQEIAKAFGGYHDSRGHYPRGGTHFDPPSRWLAGADEEAQTPQARETSWSWAYLILPHMKHGELYANPDSNTVRATPVKFYYCQARRSATAYSGLAKLDYAANAGTQPEWRNGLVMRSTLGVVRVDDVSDGLRTTLLLGEKQLNRATLGTSLDDNESYCTPGWNSDWEVYRAGLNPPEPDRELPGNTDPSQVFGGPHPGGFLCLFADGSVRFVRYSVSAGTWQKVCGRNDNLSFNNDEL